jgi:dTDP-4-amino-4,6-dideoxygalactose transaminase
MAEWSLRSEETENASTRTLVGTPPTLDVTEEPVPPAADVEELAPIPISQPSLPPFWAMEGDFRRVISSRMITNGPYTREFERRVCELTGAKHCIAVSSATAGLMLSVRALGLQGEAILPSFTWTSTGHALVWNGVRPVFCDISPATGAMDPRCLERLITDQTSAILPVHVFGLPCDIAPILEIARRHRLKVLFDSAQALGSNYQGRPVGGFGDVEVFSLSASKVVTACEGGLITTSDAALAAELRSLRDYGKSDDAEDILGFGLSARMPELCAVVGLHTLDSLDQLVAARSARARLYMERLRDVAGIEFQELPGGRTMTWSHLVVFVEEERFGMSRDVLAKRLAEKSIQTRKYFSPCLHEQTAYKGQPGIGSTALTVSEKRSREGLALPMSAHLDLTSIERVCDAVIEIGGRKRADKKEVRTKLVFEVPVVNGSGGHENGRNGAALTTAARGSRRQVKNS